MGCLSCSMSVFWHGELQKRCRATNGSQQGRGTRRRSSSHLVWRVINRQWQGCVKWISPPVSLFLKEHQAEHLCTELLYTLTQAWPGDCVQCYYGFVNVKVLMRWSPTLKGIRGRLYRRHEKENGSKRSEWFMFRYGKLGCVIYSFRLGVEPSLNMVFNRA